MVSKCQSLTTTTNDRTTKEWHNTSCDIVIRPHKVDIRQVPLAQSSLREWRMSRVEEVIGAPAEVAVEEAAGMKENQEVMVVAVEDVSCGSLLLLE